MNMNEPGVEKSPSPIFYFPYFMTLKQTNKKDLERALIYFITQLRDSRAMMLPKEN